jgi:hypothetical protein
MSFCVPSNSPPELWQNLAVAKCVLKTDLYQNKATGFHRVWVYVDEDGTGTDFEDVGQKLASLGLLSQRRERQ